MFPNLVDDESDSSSSAASRSPSVQASAPPLPMMQGPPKPHQRPIAKMANFTEVEAKNPELVQEPQPEDSYDKPLKELTPGTHPPVQNGLLGPGGSGIAMPTPPPPKYPKSQAPAQQQAPVADHTPTGEGSAFYFRFLLVPKYCGAIIGRAGCNINQLSAQTGIHVQINNYTSPTGRDMSNRDMQLREVIVTGGGANVRMGILEMYKLLLNDTQELQIKVLINHDNVPTIMGKAGATMEKLRAMAGCKIRLLSDDESVYYLPDRVVLLEGPTLMCGNACAMLVELLAEMPAAPLPDPDPQAPRGTKRPSSVMNPNPSAVPPSGPLPVTTDVASHMPQIATTTICLNKTQASMIIGRGGCTINQVRQMTNAKVVVEERQDGMRDLILSGPLDQVEAGLNLVRQVFMTESYDDNKAAQEAAQQQSNFALGDVSGMDAWGMANMMQAGMFQGGMQGWDQGWGYGPVGQ